MSQPTTDGAELVRPAYGGLCLDAVLPAVAGAVGADLDPVRAVQARAARALLDLPSAERVCVVLVDGLGERLLTERRGHAAFLRGQLGSARTLTVGYPSTTAASMGLFGTGCGAGRTGLAGYTVRNPATGRLANLVSWDGADDPLSWQREPTWFSMMAAGGTTVTSVGPVGFAGSGLTLAALRGARYVGAESLADRVDVTVRELARPGVVYLYWGEVDKAGHKDGWRSVPWGDALAELDRELARLARRLPAGTLLLVTADHGMVDVDPERLVDVAATPALREGVSLVAGEPRASHIHLDPDADPTAARDRWREVLGPHAWVLGRAEAVAEGWFGPVAPTVLPMIGDLVVAARGSSGVVDSRTQTPHSLLLRGMHGSLTAEEMYVPLVVVG